MIVYKLSNVAKSYIERYFEILEEMKAEMSSVANGSISEIYISQILPHHRAAIKMSENVLTYTTDPEIESLASNIILSEEKSIAKLESMPDSCRETTSSERDVSLYMRTFNEINASMLREMESTPQSNNLSVDFLCEMIPHHEGGIAMSKNALKFDLCKDLSEFIEQTIRAQTDQVQKMKNMLKKR